MDGDIVESINASNKHTAKSTYILEDIAPHNIEIVFNPINEASFLLTLLNFS